MSELQTYLSDNRPKFEADLCELLKIPSISTDSRYKDEVRKAAEWLHQQFGELGFETKVYETDGHPIVYAESPAVEGAPVALVYGHYDVQPPEPLDEWKSPPFEPSIRDGNVYARGATDDKGQMLTHVKSVEAWMKSVGKLPIQVKFLIEGEEEIGSEHLVPFIKEHDEMLECDVVVISDTSQFGPGQPAITYGLKGIAYYELKLTGPKQDLHSGTFGGAVTNPANTLAKMLASLIDDKGRVQVPGFYEDVDPLTDEERDQFASLDFSEADFMRSIGVEGLSGETGYSTLERRWTRPTFDINGITSGYQGEGAKTVLPAKASAKFSFRLVPQQDPKQLTESLTKHLEAIVPPGIKMELIDFHGAPGFVVPLDSPFMSAAASAIEKGFGRPPVFIREGGSIPIVTNFVEQLGVDVLLLGWGLNDDNTHSPNEKFCLADYHRGIKASAALWHTLSKITPNQD
ncbi:dipeptidase [Blastopirellula retiformator]|uniref:Succinyl-diaminopimelate desuccinylase n=1 Tax=Blastopirellula retiformator TaxID=2527970 RepID=A0A5C5UX80_9BACT|nr:dipeptidase [Blastopirellula retiformator]TWT30798.1 Succinyl-diaminopimelate desuccinylase [Blastopirellula retiformator]